MKRTIMTIMAALVLTACALSIHASTNYWDNNGDTAGFGAAGGTWGAEGKWSADSTGASVPTVTNTTDADDLYFGTGASGLESGTITVDGAGQAFRSMTFGVASGAITLLGGTLNLAAPASQVIVNNFSNTIASVLAGTNGLRKSAYEPLTFKGFLTESPATVFPQAVLSEYLGAGGIMQGAWIPNAPLANGYHFVNTGTHATCQLQAVDDNYTKCVKVELTQSGADIVARAVYAKYVSGIQLGFDFDFDGIDGVVATSPTADGYGAAQITLYPAAKVYEPFLTESATTIFANAALSECASVGITMAGGSISDTTTLITPFYFVNNGTSATVQMQAFYGDYTKCVKLELTQVGPDIAARVLYAKYISDNVLGTDFDFNGSVNSIATSYGAPGYGACQVRLNPAHVLTLAGVNTYSGDTTIGSGTLEIGEGGQLGRGSYTGAVINAGRLLYNSTSNQALCGVISGTGSLVKQSPAKTATSITYANFLTQTAAVIIPYALVSDCVGAAGVIGGGYVGAGGGSLPAGAYFFNNQGSTATYQLQAVDNEWLKCVKVELTQAGPDIAARVLYAKYISSSNPLGYNFDAGGNDQSIATSYGSGGYGAAETVLTLNRHSKLTLSGANSYRGGTVVNLGVLEVVETASALPSVGGITVNGGGELMLKVGGLGFNNAGGVGNGNPITVNGGGMLTLASTFNAGYSRPITINGGTLNSTSTEGSGDNANYINNLALLNGARVTGYNVRVGNHSSASITVSGTNASSIAAGLSMVKVGSETLTFNVADVTGDAGPDLLIPGVIRDYPNLTGLPIIKTGVGTVALSGANTHTGPITIAAGTFALGADGALNAGNPITLSGGTLDMGAFSNDVGTLTVASNSVIALGSGKLAFADSSGMSWAGTLSLTGTLGAQTVRVGTDENALTSGQLSAIRVNGERVRIKSDGYLAPALKGILIILQ